eukprot:1360571-Prymnesium_polylepis.1
MSTASPAVMRACRSNPSQAVPYAIVPLTAASADMAAGAGATQLDCVTTREPRPSGGTATTAWPTVTWPTDAPTRRTVP